MSPLARLPHAAAMLRSALQSTARTVQSTPACSAWRAFSCAAVRAAPPPGASSSGARAPSSAAPGTDALVELLEDVESSNPSAAQELQSAFSPSPPPPLVLISPVLELTSSLSCPLPPRSILHFNPQADQASVLRHLSRNQVISPQHLSPRHLLVPYQPRPNFSQAHPLGPPTSFAETHDPFVRYGLDPLRDATTNPYVLSEFVTSMGKIKSRGKTGLQRKSQRRIGKAVRRARVRPFSSTRSSTPVAASRRLAA